MKIGLLLSYSSAYSVCIHIHIYIYIYMLKSKESEDPHGAEVHRSKSRLCKLKLHLSIVCYI